MNVCICRALFYEPTSFTFKSILTRKPWFPLLSFLKTEVNAATVSWRPSFTFEPNIWNVSKPSWHVLKFNFREDFHNRDSFQILMQFSVVSAGLLLTEFFILLFFFLVNSVVTQVMLNQNYSLLVWNMKDGDCIVYSKHTVCGCTLELVILFPIFREIISCMFYTD